MTQAIPTLTIRCTPSPLPPPFLTAQWRYLAMLNYEIDPDLLAPLVPRGTELDTWNGRTFVSLVGFCFWNAKIRGIAVPFHRNFTEVNLRFYVVRRHDGEERRGVVFVREIVPRLAVAVVARVAYGEHFCCMPMRHRIEHDPLAVEYAWRFGGRWCRMFARTAGGAAARPAPGSHEEFIAEHYWGYTRLADGGCSEYCVEHPPWRCWRAVDAGFDADVERLYGARFAAALGAEPFSAFVADGSAVTVRKGARLC